MEYLVAWGRERGARKMFLEVRVSNAPARALYRRLGFVETGRRKNYYAEEQEDALTMARRI
jgi:ribosomal protein S18 acetylase RimI-like enzyme